MFDPAEETEPDWDAEIREDMVAECTKYGRVAHIYVDKASLVRARTGAGCVCVS